MYNDEIKSLIGKIRERYDHIQDPSGRIVRIEVDLLQADIRELYEKTAALIQTMPSVVPSESQFSKPDIPEKSQMKVETVSEPEFIAEPALEAHSEQHVAEKSVIREPVTQHDFLEMVAPSPVIQEKMEDVFTPPPFPDPVPEALPPKEVVPPAVKQTPEYQVSEQSAAPAVHIHETTSPVHSTLDLFGAPTTTLADKFRDEKRSINEKLNLETSGDKSIGSRLRLKITDLRSAIGINDRFIFINELFEGDMRMYDDMLGRLNTCTTLQEAIAVFDNTKIAQGWSDELNSVERLLDFIHRRFA